MVLTREERENLLENVWNVPRSEICTAVRSTLKLKNQRRTTVTNLSSSTKFEEVLESAGRKCKRAISFQRRPSAQAAQLTKEHLAAEAQRKAIWEKLVESSDHLGQKVETVKRPRAQERAADNSIHSAPAVLSFHHKKAHQHDERFNEQGFKRFIEGKKSEKEECPPVLARERDKLISDNDFEPSWNPDASQIRQYERGGLNENLAGQDADASQIRQYDRGGVNENLAGQDADAGQSPGKKKKKKGKKGKKGSKKKRSASLS